MNYQVVKKTIHANINAFSIVGLCHDLDYFLTVSDRTRHGLLTAELLEGLLPRDALKAIAAHDHRTGVHDDSSLARTLRAADALAVLRLRPKELERIMEGADNVFARLDDELGPRRYFVKINQEYIETYGFDFAVL